jgi:hypothetical protein
LRLTCRAPCVASGWSPTAWVGYASGTIAGVSTRRYHGLLVAALSTHEYADGTIDPHGYRHLVGFRLEGAIPVWTFFIADALLERRVWLAYGANTAYVRYTLVRGQAHWTWRSLHC